MNHDYGNAGIPFSGSMITVVSKLAAYKRNGRYMPHDLPLTLAG
jgi:hypothetical protein